MQGKGRIHNRLITQGQLEQARQLHPLPWHVPADLSEKDYGCSFFKIPPPIFLSLHPLRSALQAKYNVSDFPSYILIRFESCLVRL